MTLVRSTAHDDYLPAFGTLLIVDHWDWDAAASQPGDGTTDEGDEGDDEGDPLGEDLTLGDVSAFTSAGRGWLRAGSRDASHLLRLELHSGEPDDDLTDWSEAAVTPYLSRTGMVAPGMVADGPEPEFALALSGPGTYLVRVCVRPRAQEDTDLAAVVADDPPTGDEQTWRLQFWRTTDPSPLPFRLHRGTAIGSEQVGWEELFPCLNQLVNAWLAKDFERYPATQRDHEQWNDLARRLALPPADSVAGAQQLLLAVGMLEDVGGDEQTRYRLTLPSAGPGDLLTLTAEEQTTLAAGDRRRRVGTLLDDVVALARWVQAGGSSVSLAVSLAGIAERVLAPADLVREALELAVADQRLAVVPGIAAGMADDAPLRLVVLPDPSLASNAGYHYTQPDDEPALPARQFSVGAPARAGYLMADGRVIVQRDGQLHELAVVPDGQQAWQLAEGILVQTTGMPVVVGTDGSLHPIEVPAPADSLLEPAVSSDGRRAYLASWQFGPRRLSKHSVFRVDLVEGTVTDLGWPIPLTPRVIAVLEEGGGDTLLLVDRPRFLSWQPPAEPERMPLWVAAADAVSRTLVGLGPEGPAVLRPDGTLAALPVEVTAVVPGGGAAVEYRFESERYTITRVPLGATVGEPTTLQFDVGPTDLAIGDTVIWEDAYTAVVPSPELALEHAVRLDLRTGGVERLALPPGAPIGTVTKPLPFR